MFGLRLLLAVLALVVAIFPAWGDAASEAALAVFRDYQARSERFDPSLADLYDDAARITSKRLMPDGAVRTLAFTGEQWKAMIRQFMPVARQRGDVNSFSKVTARPAGTNQVMIRAERYNHLKGYRSPFELVLRRDRHGNWQIVEERSETRL